MTPVLPALQARRFDVVVIGAGPGGYVAALRAAGHGLSVAVVERDRAGGVCANRGCIPTKALLRSAEVYALAKNAAEFGIRAADVSFDLAAVVERARRAAARMEQNVEALLRAARVPLVRGTARLAGRGRVAVTTADGDESMLEAEHVVLATGARPRVPEGLEPDGRLVWTYEHALAPTAMPASLVVVGAGAIGVELASFWRTLGADVTLVEERDRVLPREDVEISEAMRRAMRRQGIRVRTGATVVAAEPGEDRVAVTIDVHGVHETIVAERVLVATGIAANVEGLGLEGTGVRIEHGCVVVDEWLRTGEPAVFAIGDLTGGPWLAHKASREAEICVDRLAGVPGVRALDPWSVPSCTYAAPEVASVGLTEEAAAAGHRLRVGRATFVGNGRARALGDTTGLVKTVFDADTGELLGAHLVGPQVTELIATFALARTLEATEAELLATVFAHPTLAEAMHESAAAAFTGSSPGDAPAGSSCRDASRDAAPAGPDPGEASSAAESSPAVRTLRFSGS